MRGTFKKLRLRIVAATMLLLSSFLMVGMLILNAELLGREIYKVRSFLTAMADNGGVRPEPVGATGKLGFALDEFRGYFAVVVSEDGVFRPVDGRLPSDFTLAEVDAIVSMIKAEKIGEDDRGRRLGLVWLWRDLADGGRLLCVVNRRGEIETLRRLRRVSVVVFVASLAVAFAVSVVVSSFLVRPAELAFRRQKEFIANAGHELKTPIAVIGANIDVLESDLRGNRWLGYIRAENERMGKLVKNLLYLAKNDSNSQDLQFVPLDLAQVVRNAVLPFEGVFYEQGKTLKISVPGAIPVLGDEMQLKQVVMILVDNALKNSEEGALVRVGASVDGGHAVATVFNTGHGIAGGDLERIFQRFYRGDSSRARKSGGYGLGLTIARAIAESHKGTLTADSRAGEWAEFRLSLPLNQARRRLF